MNSVFKHIAFIGLFLYSIMSALMVTSCGQRGVPTGGAKDTIPPQILSSYPENYSTGFTGKKITLTFDEYVQVRSIAKEFLISPPVEKVPEYTLKGKKLILEFDSTLNENTTYSLYLGSAVVDLNEGNELDSNLFVFSTGNFIDSLTLKGTINEAYSGKAAEDILVHLYKNTNDTAPLTELPAYFAQAKDGRFNFSNLAEGEYRIFALRDVNRNYKFDSPEEEIAFDTSIITLPYDEETFGKIKLKIFTSELEKQRLFKPSSQETFAITLSFAKPVGNEKLSYTFLDSALQKCAPIEVWSAKKDTVHLYAKEFEAGKYVLMDLALDTFKLDSAKVKISKDGGSYSFKSNFRNAAGANFNEAMHFEFKIPVKSICDTCFVMIKDSTDTLQPTFKKINDSKYILNVKFEEKANYELLIDSAAFTSVINHSTDKTKFFLPMLSGERLGNLLVKFDGLPHGYYILELWSEKRKELEKTFSSADAKVKFEGVAAGDYYLKLVEDLDNNGLWTTGNYFENRQAEVVFPYPQKVEIRANWDMDLDWNFNEHGKHHDHADHDDHSDHDHEGVEPQEEMKQEDSKLVNEPESPAE